MVHIFSPKPYSAVLQQSSLWYVFTSWFCLHNYEMGLCVLLKRRKSVSPFPLSVVHKCFMQNMYLQWSRKGLWVLSIPESHHQNTQPVRVYKPWNMSCIKTVCDFTKDQWRDAILLSSNSGATTTIFNTSILGWYSRRGGGGGSIFQHKQGQVLSVWKPTQTIAPTSATSHIKGELIPKLVPDL